MSPPISRPAAPGREHMRAIRLARGLTYREVAKRFAELGHPRNANTIARYESGYRSVDTDDLLVMAKVYNATPNQLLGIDPFPAGGNAPQTQAKTIGYHPAPAAYRKALRVLYELDEAQHIRPDPDLLAELQQFVAEAIDKNKPCTEVVSAAQVAAQMALRLRS
jgi:transcriptional regulator with XRE-family HTH domain